jgi:hypothetical protein
VRLTPGVEERSAGRGGDGEPPADGGEPPFERTWLAVALDDPELAAVEKPADLDVGPPASTERG